MNVILSVARRFNASIHNATACSQYAAGALRLGVCTDSGRGSDQGKGAKIAQLTQHLKFAIEGAQNSGASANLAFLERDPTERGPRAQFELDATIRIRDYIQSGVRDAKRFIESDTWGRRSYDHAKRLRTLQTTLELAELTILDLNAKIVDTQERMRKLEEDLKD